MKRTVILGVFLVAAAAVILGVVMAQTRPATPTATPVSAATQGDLRNVRYCEIIPVVRTGFKMTAYVYNTLGLNDCPSDLWEALDAETVARDYGALQAKLNGPRYWVINRLESSGATASGKTVDFGGIEMTLRAEISTRIGQKTVGDTPYTPNQVQRTTVFTYFKGSEVYELVSPDGDVYMMQSYSQIIDPELTIDDLAALGDRLTLPQGWQYRSRMLDEDYRLVADGIAYVINDDFLNSYQRASTATKTKSS